MGYILLEGGAEFGGRMAVPDRMAMSLAGGPDAPVSIIPAAAAPDKNHLRAAQNGVRWFQSLGATKVFALPLIDRLSADDPEVVEDLRRSCLIYLLGGFPRHLALTLMGSSAWEAILNAYQSGAVIAGSSAGAMVLCEHYYDPMAREILKGLGLLPRTCVLPHHDTFGKKWASRLARILPETILIGIDEETGMLNDGLEGRWQVYGKGTVTLYGGQDRRAYASGETFRLDKGSPESGFHGESPRL